jgi:hypothetical protein
MAHARWTYFEPFQALGLLHELLHEKAEIRLIGSGDIVVLDPLEDKWELVAVGWFGGTVNAQR